LIVTDMERINLPINGRICGSVVQKV
jgi:hypothetical protein